MPSSRHYKQFAWQRERQKRPRDYSVLTGTTPACSNGDKNDNTADFTCVEQLVYSVAWPYTCKSITESRYGINKLFNASEIRCTADFTCVEQLVYSVP